MNSLVASLALVSIATAQDTTRYTHADTLRGSNGPGRAWWDVQFYDLHTRVNLRDSSITGWNAITYRVLQPARHLLAPRPRLHRQHKFDALNLR